VCVVFSSFKRTVPVVNNEDEERLEEVVDTDYLSLIEIQ